MKKPRTLGGPWLLTPVVVGLGTFFFGWLGALLGGRLVWLVVGGLVGSLVGLGAWSVLLLFLERKQKPADD